MEIEGRAELQRPDSLPPIGPDRVFDQGSHRRTQPHLHRRRIPVVVVRARVGEARWPRNSAPGDSAPGCSATALQQTGKVLAGLGTSRRLDHLPNQATLWEAVPDHLYRARILRALTPASNPANPTLFCTRAVERIHRLTVNSRCWNPQLEFS
jgi:hypothetical protein